MACRIDFYHDAPDRLEVAVRIAQKAYAAGNRMLVVAPDANIREAFDRLLWTHGQSNFVPHCLAEHRLAAETPVVIAKDVPEQFSADVLLNLGDDQPQQYDRFDRIIEIVSRDGDDAPAARLRFRDYRNAGHEVNSHRLGERS